METVLISKQEYKRLKRKERVADDVLLQLERSLQDAENGRVRKAVH